MIVDDNTASLTSLQSTLNSFTFQTFSASSTKDALIAVKQAIVENTPYQLILLDQTLLHMDGIETARKIIKTVSDTQANLPKIILLTPFNMQQTVEQRAKNAGVDRLLDKPVNRSLLFDTIMEVFEKDVLKRYQSRKKEFDTSTIADQIGGCHLLLVEDLPINQQVARELLEEVGIHVQIANNGVEAVQMVQNTEYDAVLMDIQMPVMDGHQATRSIRKIPHLKQLPIIAMTAHVLSDAQEKCLKSGMNDHLGKPIDPKRLFSILTTHIKPNSRTLDNRKPFLKTTVQTEKTINFPKTLPGIDIESALNRVMGNQSLLLKLWSAFNRDYATMVEDIQHAFAQGKSEEARKNVHKIKGISGNIGAYLLHEAADKLDLSIKQGHTADWPILTKQFISNLQDILTTTANLNPAPKETLVSESKKQVKPSKSLIQLSDHLERFEQDAIHLFDTIKPNLIANGFKKEVDQMEQMINHYDFLGAQKIVKMISDSLDVSLEYLT